MKSTGSVKLAENSSQMKLESGEIASLDDIQIPAKGHEEGNEWLSDAENTGKSVLCARKKQKKQIMFMSTKLILSAKSADMNEP